MKKAALLALVIVSLLLMTSVAFAEHGNIGGVGVCTWSVGR